MTDRVPPGAAAVRRRVLAWYDRARRNLPWRAAPGERADPYHVWLSEVMLQQTGVATVGRYYRVFLARWPTIADLAAAPLDDVLHAWAGLGYYARARNLHACARAVTGDAGGRFPDTVAGLAALPGIGPYTAAAIGAIAFGRPVLPVDGNIERVLARLHCVETPLPAAKPALRHLAAGLASARRPGDLAQALMDLGATLCLPRRPACGRCPLAGLCRARAAGRAGDLPRRAPKVAKPTRAGTVFWLTRADGAVLFRRRPERGLLGGMMAPPTSAWIETPAAAGDTLAEAPLKGLAWRPLAGEVRHTFTHFHLVLKVWRAQVDAVAADRLTGTWSRPEAFSELALPTLVKKVCALALGARP